MDTEKRGSAAAAEDGEAGSFAEALCSACGAEMKLDWTAMTATCLHCGSTASIYSYELAAIVGKRQLIAEQHRKQVELEQRAAAIRAELGRRSDIRDIAGALVQFLLGIAACSAAIWAVWQLADGCAVPEVLSALVAPLLLVAWCAANTIALRAKARKSTLEAMNQWGLAGAFVIIMLSSALSTAGGV